jgi:hypothetical protein
VTPVAGGVMLRACGQGACAVTQVKLEFPRSRIDPLVLTSKRAANGVVTAASARPVTMVVAASSTATTTIRAADARRTPTA